MKYLTYLVIMAGLIATFQAAQTWRYKNSRATSFDNSSIVVRYCGIKVYSRKHQDSSLILGLTFLQPLDRPVHISMLIEFKYGTIFREAYKSNGTTAENEWCSMMDGSSKNLLIDTLVNLVKDSIPQVIHKCPFEKGELDINMTINHNKIASIYPSGFYRSKLVISKGKKALLEVSSTFEVKSEIRTSF